MDLPDIELIEARWKLDLATNKELVDFATVALAEGCKGKAILKLAAGLAEDIEVRVVFGDVLKEMGRRPISREEAGFRIARITAKQLLFGEIEPEEGAKSIARLGFEMDTEGYEPYCPDWLTGFYNLVDQWDTYYWNRPDEYRAKIVQEAELLIRKDLSLRWVSDC